MTVGVRPHLLLLYLRLSNEKTPHIRQLCKAHLCLIFVNKRSDFTNPDDGDTTHTAGQAALTTQKKEKEKSYAFEHVVP